MPDYSLIDLKKARAVVEQTDLGTFDSEPLLQVAKTIDGLAKILLVRLQINEAVKAAEFTMKV